MPESEELPPTYLDVEDVVGLHAAILGCTEEQAEDHIRNRPGLEGAVSRPITYAHYTDADIAMQAAVLAHGIAETQPFVDGNKRTALVAMVTFLEINGLGLTNGQDERARWMLELAGGLTPAGLADRLRPALVRRPPA